MTLWNTLPTEEQVLAERPGLADDADLAVAPDRDERADLAAYRRTRRRARTRRLGTGALGPAILAVLWQLTAMLINDPVFLPSVSATAARPGPRAGGHDRRQPSRACTFRPRPHYPADTANHPGPSRPAPASGGEGHSFRAPRQSHAVAHDFCDDSSGRVPFLAGIGRPCLGCAGPVVPGGLGVLVVCCPARRVRDYPGQTRDFLMLS